MKSKKWSLNVRDLIHGFLMAMSGSVVSAIVPLLQTGTFPTEAQIMTSVKIGIGFGVVYLLKNFTSNSQGEILKQDIEDKK